MTATPTVIDLDRDGAPRGEGKSYDPKIGLSRTPPKFLSSLDLSILGAMMRMRKIDYAACEAAFAAR